MKLGNKSGDAPPEMVEVGASGKLVESNDLAVRFEILGNELEKQSQHASSRFASLESAQAQILSALRGMRGEYRSGSHPADSPHAPAACCPMLWLKLEPCRLASRLVFMLMLVCLLTN